MKKGSGFWGFGVRVLGLGILGWLLKPSEKNSPKDGPVKRNQGKHETSQEPIWAWGLGFIGFRV